MARTVPPGPPGGWLTGNLAELKRDVLGLYGRCASEYGDCFRLRFGLKPVYFFTHPDAVEQILTSRHMVKHYALKMNRLLLGNGLLSSEGEFWVRQRRLIQPAFLRERILGYARDMTGPARELADTWQPGQTRDVYADLRQLTLVIAAKTLFGADAAGQGPAVHEALQAVMDGFNNRLFSVLRLPESFPTPRNIRAWRAVRRLDALLYGIIERSRASGEGGDLLSLLLRARDEGDGQGMSDKQLRDEAMTLFLAGHDTTALALTWTLYLLAQHPEVQDELQAELQAVLGDRDPTGEDLPRLRLAEMIVQEGMRLYPPAYALGRQATQACQVAGYDIDVGQTVLVLQWVVHRDARWYDDPLAFRPRRWEGGLAKRLPKFAYFPFGGGPRVCVGNHFAMMEAVLVLATLCRGRRFALDSPDPIRPRPRLTLAPDRPVNLHIIPAA